MKPLTDCHIHCDNAKLISDAVPNILSYGIDRMAFLSYGKMEAKEWNGGPGNSNPQVLAGKALFPDRVFAFAGPNHLPALGCDKEAFAANLVQQVDNWADTGFDGVKFIEHKPSFHPKYPYKLDDPAFDPFYRQLIRRGLPVLWHVGDPESFWDPEKAPEMAHVNGWFYGNGDFPSLESLWRDSLSVLDRHPDLPVIFAHFFFMSPHLERLGTLLDQHPGMNVDITPGTEMYANFSANHAETREFFIHYQDRIFFGTDLCIRESSFYEPAKDGKVAWMRRFLETDDIFELGNRYSGIHGLRLPEQVLDKIYVDNFSRLVGEKPRPLSKPAAIRACNELIADVLDASFSENDVKLFEEARAIIEGA